MAPHSLSSTTSTSLNNEAHARLLYTSLEQYNRELRKRRRPSVILAALIILFLSSISGIALAVVLIVKAAEIQDKGSLPRDLIFFAGVLSLLYICMHIRGARKNYVRRGVGVPMKYGSYLHASALLVARLGIITWLGALVATATIAAKTTPSSPVSILNLLLCTSAIPPFLIISITIERNTTPFLTAALSPHSFLSSRASDLSSTADDLTADSSISRRATRLAQRKLPSESGTVLTLPTEAIFRLGAPDELEKYARAAQNFPVANPSLRGPSPPQEVYHPGGWRAGAGIVRLSPNYSSASSHTSTSHTSSSSSSSSRHQTPTRSPTTSSIYDRFPAPPSDFSTMRYVYAPEIAVRQAIRVVRNPAYAGKEKERDVSSGSIRVPLERKPSNFSRPMRYRDSGVEVRIPGAYAEDEDDGEEEEEEGETKMYELE